MTLTPAYGRDYKSAKAVKADWNANKDFVVADMFSGNPGGYVNKEQLPKEAIDLVFEAWHESGIWETRAVRAREATKEEIYYAKR